jgi:uncharacterized protein DUF664
MTVSTQLLTDAFGRIQDVVHEAVDGLTPEELAFRLDREANSIGWLVWHLTRVQDDHIADAGGLSQVWTGQGWVERCGLPFDPADTGYGHSSAEVGAVRVSADLLVGYYDAVHGQTVGYLETLGDGDMERVVDEGWDPPVTLGVRLVSVISDDLQHAGQAAFMRGLLPK